LSRTSTDNWGRWGKEDERGALNHLSAEKVLAATQACRTGRVYQLGMPIQREGVPFLDFRGAPQRHTLTDSSDERMFEKFGAEVGTGTNEDVLVLPSHSATHMDALCHVYTDEEMYNGFAPDSMHAFGGASRCGIEKAGAVAGRGVLIDVAAHYGEGPLEAGRAITPEDLQQTLERQGTEIRPGDIVLVRTGWLQWCVDEVGGEMSFEQPGLGRAAAGWLGERDVALVGADNSAVEVLPFDGDAYLGGHIELLVKRGVNLIEHLNLRELSADRCHEFLFTVGPLLVTGATASPVNPIAIG
jgi:kynurenine formamidase